MIRDTLAAELGCVFTVNRQENLETRFLGMLLYLDSPSTKVRFLEPAMKPSDYEHCIYTYTSAGSPSRQIQLVATALLPSVLSCLPVPRCNLVYDNELLLAEYEIGGTPRRFYDRISGRDVTYPEHLAMVTARLEQLRP